MTCVIPRANLVRNIGFDEKATHTVEKEFADLVMHRPEAAKFPLTLTERTGFDALLDDRVFATHYRVLEGRRNLWEILRDRLFPAKGIPAK